MDIRETILLVDDDPDVLGSYRLLLESAGFDVLTASDTAQALESLGQAPVAACLIDLRLGREDGLKLASELVQADEALVVFILTAHPGYDSAVQAMRSGVQDYLSKVEAPEVLLEKLRSALGRRRESLARKRIQVASQVALVCGHDLVKAGLEHLCAESGSFALRAHARTPGGYLPREVDLLVVCEECLRRSGDMVQGLGLLQGALPGRPILLINSQSEGEEAMGFLPLGVQGFLAPDAPAGVLQRALESLRDGHFWISRGLASQALREFLRQGAVPRPAEGGLLSLREHEVLQAMALGLSNGEVGRKLFISENTVKIHVNRILRKLEVRSRTQAVLRARELGLI